jgi:hypothetical protein
MVTFSSLPQSDEGEIAPTVHWTPDRKCGAGESLSRFFVLSYRSP